jgi:hypothetical protein
LKAAKTRNILNAQTFNELQTCSKPLKEFPKKSPTITNCKTFPKEFKSYGRKKS